MSTEENEEDKFGKNSILPQALICCATQSTRVQQAESYPILGDFTREHRRPHNLHCVGNLTGLTSEAVLREFSRHARRALAGSTLFFSFNAQLSGQWARRA